MKMDYYFFIENNLLPVAEVLPFSYLRLPPSVVNNLNTNSNNLSNTSNTLINYFNKFLSVNIFYSP